jgi:hypothetical protein
MPESYLALAGKETDHPREHTHRGLAVCLSRVEALINTYREPEVLSFEVSGNTNRK